MTAEERPRGSWLLGDDMTGKTSGWLEVIGPAERPEGSTIKIRGTWWICRCKCGTEKVLPRQYITQKTVTSCGCKKRGPKIDVDRQALIVTKERPKRVRKNPAGLATSWEELAKTCTCAACGKKFERLSNAWAYKITIGSRLYWLCSWRCLHKVKYEKQGLRVVEV